MIFFKVRQRTKRRALKNTINFKYKIVYFFNSIRGNMIKIKLIILILFIFGCSSNYNTPFINTDETTKFKFGMTQEEVLKITGPPLFVSKVEKNEIVWVYEVRTELVASDETSTGEIIVNKSHQFTKPNKPIHKLYLTFSKGKLSNWGQYDG